MLKKLNKNLKEKILGQDEIINSICAYTRKIYFGFKKDKPYSFLFVGPTGVGKTLFVKEYATSLYGSDNFIRIDMSEYKEEYSISKLLGSAPGYVGYRENNTVMEKYVIILIVLFCLMKLKRPLLQLSKFFFRL